MPVELTPRLYRQNFKWGVLPKNKIDTVIMSPINNTPRDDEHVITEEVTEVNIGGVVHALPLGTDVARTNFHRSKNVNVSGDVMASGIVEVVNVSGKVTFNLDAPLAVEPALRVSYEGNTYYASKGTFSHKDIVTAIDNSASFNIADAIKQNATGSTKWIDRSTDASGNTLVDYTSDYIPRYPWVRKLVPAEGGVTSTQKSDIITKWADTSLGSIYNYAVQRHWSDYGAYNAVSMWPYVDRSASSITLRDNMKIVIRNLNNAPTFRLTKVDDYTYTVFYTVPMRYTYAASSQYFEQILFIKTFTELDNYAFTDFISKMTISLVSRDLDTTPAELSYSEDSSGQLTEITSNEHPISFSANELITSKTYWGETSELWATKMSKYLIDKFRQGKYVVECDVSASWAIKQSLTINTLCNIKLQDGTYISRGSTPCDFEIKTIEKRYNNNDYIYSLRLMEV